MTLQDNIQDVTPIHSSLVIEPDLNSPEFYLNRELSWLKFNWRVLNEASDPRTPLLERVKFLAIVSSNIDEFCMKRIGGLRLQIDAGVEKLTIDGRSPAEQVELCAQEMEALREAKEKVYRQLLPKLKRERIIIRDYTRLKKRDKEWLRAYYIANVMPITTPQAIDISHPFPFISNQSLNLFVSLEKRDSSVINVRVKVPTGDDVPRFVRLPPEGPVPTDTFVRLEEVMVNNLDLLFPNMKVLSRDIFRITRNANTASDHSGADDLVEMIEADLRDRRYAPVIRMQMGPSFSPVQRQKLIEHLQVDTQHTIMTSNSMMGMADLMELAGLARPSLKHPPHIAVTNHKLEGGTSIFEEIDAHRSILLQHPYESFETSVERFVKEASVDPKVRAIKMTIYRTSTDTKIVNYLIDAAQNGKQVAVVVELTASFDESANIKWARRLEEAGIHVSFGIYGLKTHSKVILVVRKNPTGLRRYAHVSTGNYHARNAKIYSDFGVLTSDDALTHDLGELFNYLTTGCSPLRPYNQLLTAPLYIKKALLAKIAREGEHAKRGKQAHIRLKANALEDPDITRALYEASRAGAKIDLIIRDICRLRPGLKNMSDTIRVVSIVGQFLEHGRIYHFHNAGDDEYFIGSADLMSRNLERRVEILIPVNDADARSELSEVLHMQIADPRNAWDMDPNGDYLQRTPSDDNVAGSQTAAIEAAEDRFNGRQDCKKILVLKEMNHG